MTYRYPLHKDWLFIKLLFLLIFFCSCRKIIEVDPPVDEVVSAEVFADDPSALSAMAGLYNRMMSVPLSMTNAGLSVYGGLAADEIYNLYPGAEETQFAANQLLKDNNTINQSFWFGVYPMIYHANAIIEGLEKSNNISSPLRQRLEGEARFLRAFYYFYLVNLFGDVPLVITTDYAKNAVHARTPKEEIYRVILDDLGMAASLLEADYPVPGKFHPNKYAAYAMLGRVSLFLGDWERAADYAGKLINSGIYQLEPGPATVFTTSNTETIWQLKPYSTSYFTGEGLSFVPFFPGFEPSYPMRTTFLEQFESNDLRKTAWIGLETVNGIEYYYPYKYKTGFCSGSCTEEYSIVLRLAEQYLVRAEAQARLGNEAAATDDINKIRQRAGLDAIMPANVEEIIAALVRERRAEFFSEWGHRWLDLCRWNIAGIVLAPIKPGWNPEDQLFPIPESEIRLNPFLSQNPGY